MQRELILVINCGSSSLKFSLICLATKQTLKSGLAEKLGTKDASLTVKYDGEKETSVLASPHNHQVAINDILSSLKAHNLAHEIIAIGHRIVHGGEIYSAPTLITNNVIKTIQQLSSLAPLHNPANLIGIKATQHALPALPQVAVFDTAFHQTMPKHAYLYAVPYALYKEHGIRRYGFHGTSHYYVAQRAAQLLNKAMDKTNVITVHLGNGCSISAIKNGLSVDTSMGLTPLEGLVMGTRSGDIDPGLLMHLTTELGYSADKLNTLLNKESGLLGLSGLSNDCRTLEDAALNQKHEQSQLALAIFSYRIAKYICSYTAALLKLDAIVFTGGIGENSSYIRKQVIKRLSLLNITVNDQQNETCRFGQEGNIADTNSRPCFVIPTNEEWVIAEQTQQILTKD